MLSILQRDGSYQRNKPRLHYLAGGPLNTGPSPVVRPMTPTRRPRTFAEPPIKVIFTTVGLEGYIDT